MFNFDRLPGGKEFREKLDAMTDEEYLAWSHCQQGHYRIAKVLAVRATREIDGVTENSGAHVMLLERDGGLAFAAWVGPRRYGFGLDKFSLCESGAMQANKLGLTAHDKFGKPWKIPASKLSEVVGEMLSLVHRHESKSG